MSSEYHQQLIKELIMRGLVFYEGPSQIDGKPIVGIATFQTRNEKTGNLIQTWILRSDIEPIVAIHNGEDESICGTCPLRGYINNGQGNKDRGCYVAVHNAPYQIYKAYQNGRYPKYDKSHKDLFHGRKLRMGSYGDPVAIPRSAWKPLLDLTDGHTGYTHQWNVGKFWRWRELIMASTHTESENQSAKSKGWRTFRTVETIDDQVSNEIVCPASAEAGYKRSCETCMACNGSNGNPNRKDIVIVAHGRRSVIGSTKRTIAALNAV